MTGVGSAAPPWPAYGAGDDPEVPETGAAGGCAAEARTAGSPRALDAEAAAALTRRMERQGSAWEFSQVVRALERLRPERTPVGGFGDPGAEVARFAAHPSLAFPPGDIEAVRFPDEGEDGPVRVEVNFLGLVGPAGVLPRPYTQYVAERAAAKDTALRDFLDLFHHRLASLFHRADEAGRPHATVGAGSEADRLSAHLRALLGLGMPALQERLAIPDAALLHWAALLAPRVRSAAGLGHLLSAHLGVPCAVEEFVGAWYPLGEGVQCALGADDETCLLGVGSVVGNAAWDHQARVRVRLGPMGRSRFEALLPGGAAHAAVCALARFAADDAVEIEVRLLLAAEEVPPTVLGAPLCGGLGRGSWLSTRAPACAPEDVTFVIA